MCRLQRTVHLRHLSLRPLPVRESVCVRVRVCVCVCIFECVNLRKNLQVAMMFPQEI